MRRLRSWIVRLAGVFGAGRRDRDIDDELRAHRDLLTDEYVRSGLAPEDARRCAAAAFGSVAAAADAYRDRRGLPWIEHLVGDVRFASRLLRKRPVFAVSAILTLALAIGANVAIFSLIDRVLLHPLDVPDPSSLITLEQASRAQGRNTELTWDQADRLRRSAAFGSIAIASTAADGAASRVRVTTDNGGTGDYVAATFVSSAYFRVLGLAPALGRDFDAADDSATGSPVALVSASFWRAHLAASPSVVGRTIRVNDVPAVIIGVVPGTFTGTELGAATPDLFLPLMQAPQLATNIGMQTDGRGGFFTTNYPGGSRSPVSPVRGLAIAARVGPSARARAEAEARALLGDESWTVQPLADTMLPFASRADLRRFLVLLAAVVGLTLTAGCANLASLLLARVEERRVDLAIRAALGASRGRLIQQLGIEAGLLAAAGGLAAWLVARWIDQGLSSFVLPGNISIAALRSGLDVRAFVFATMTTTAVALLIAIVPAANGTGRPPASDLLGRAGGSSRLGLTRLFVAVQVAVCVVLVFGAGLFVRSLSRALATDLGFEPRGLISATIAAPNLGVRALEIIDTLSERARAIPGVSRVTAGPLPLIPGRNVVRDALRIDGQQPDLDAGIDVIYVPPDYFGTLGVPVLQGRDFTDGDRAGSRYVAILNEATARRFWGDATPLEHQVGFPRPGSMAALDLDYTVIGVVKSVKVRDLRETSRPIVYLARKQHEMYLSGFIAGSRSASLVLRTAGTAGSLRTAGTAGSVAPSLSALARDAGVSVQSVMSVDDRLKEILMPQRLGRALLLLFGVTALVLTAVGVYGLVSCLVAHCTKEIGVRIALGAASADIIRALGSRAATPMIAGVMTGSLAAWLGGSLVDGFMYGIKGSDASTIAFAVAVIVLAAIAAAVTPLRRALRIDPIDTLRLD